MDKAAPESIGDIARLLSEYRAYSELEDKCKNCELKNRVERTLEDAVKEYLSKEIYHAN